LNSALFLSLQFTAWVDDKHVQTAKKRKRQAQEPEAPPSLPDFGELLESYRRR
jgi:hypothetical protein